MRITMTGVIGRAKKKKPLQKKRELVGSPFLNFVEVTRLLSW